MTCEHCCGADRLFDPKSARAELAKYKRKGARRTTRRLYASLAASHYTNRSLLDIGGGIGAIQWYALKLGASKATDVDASSGYIETVKTYAREKELMDKMDFHVGDFVDLADQIEPHDIVTLDKVICCYPDYRKLLEVAMAKSRKFLLLSFPQRNWISRLLSDLGALYMRTRGNTFRPYIHPPDQVATFIRSAGYVQTVRRTSFPWHVWVFERIAS